MSRVQDFCLRLSAAFARAMLLVLVVLLTSVPATGGEPFPLRLEGAILLALERSPELEVERYSAQAAGTQVNEALGAFDPEVSARYTHEESRRQTTAREDVLENPDAAVRRNLRDQGSAEITKPFATGTEFSVSADSGRSKSNFSREQFSASLDAELRQSLLRGRGRAVNLVRVRVAENRALIGRYAFEAALQDLLLGVESAYWDLVFARQALAVREQSLNTARQLLGDTRARVEAGRLPRVELAAARAEVAARTESLEDARASLRQAELELLRWLVPDEELPWSSALQPVDEPAGDLPRPDVEEAVSQAREKRPDLLQARLELANGELEVIETRNGLLPRLDLFAGYGRSGLGTGLRDSWETVFREDFRTWTLGLSYEDRIGKRAEKARHRRAGFQRARAEAAVQNLALTIEVQVRRAAVELRRLARKVELAAATVAARQEETAGERARFDAGRSTAADVLQAENRLREAQLSRWRARTDAAGARAEYLRLQGVLTQVWGVEAH